MASTDKQAAAARKVAELIAPHLQGDLCLELWNGDLVPLGPNARDDIRIAIKSPGTVRRLLMKPTLMNVFELYAEEEIDIKGASPLEASLRWDHLKALHLKKNIDRMAVARAALPFLTWRAPYEAPVLGFTSEIANVYGKGRKDQDMVSYHYDVSDAFYALFLDREMIYSAGYHESEDVDIHQAQIVKMDRICRKLELGPDDHLLEIGSGWGGFALHAARHYGCRVTTTTISQEQYHLARDRVREAGLENRVTVLCQDYRDLRGAFDKLVSIEMIEAVGERHLKTYFHACAQLLKPHGMMLLQAITVADQKYAQYRNEVDFIRHYIFPGGFLPSLTAIAETLGRVTDLRIYHLEDIGPHYATTLRHWRARFLANLDRVRALGFPDTFIRMWEYYLCYCEGGFRERAIGTVQLLLTKPLCRREPLTPVLA